MSPQVDAITRGSDHRQDSQGPGHGKRNAPNVFIPLTAAHNAEAAQDPHHPEDRSRRTD